MKSLARFCVRRRWYVLFAWLALFILINVVSSSLGSAYSNSFTLPGTNSTQAQALLATGHQQGDVDDIVFQSTGGTVLDHKAAIEVAVTKIAHLPEVESVGIGGISKNGKIGFVTVQFSETSFKLTNPRIQAVEDVATKLRSSTLSVNFAGNAFGALDQRAGSPDEIFGLIATAIVLVLAFGSFFAMLLPLAVALFALGISLAAGSLLSHALPIAQFTPELGSLIGLGVGIDYALFIVTRSRQELKRGQSTEDAVVTSLNTSGRAVLFAGVTVCIALLGLLVLGISFLNGLALAASITVLTTMAASVTLLPALLGFWNQRVLSRRERRVLKENGPGPLVVGGPWQRWANFVSRHPRVLSISALVIIIAFVVPFFSLHLGSSDQGTDPAGSTTRLAYDQLATGFGPGVNGPLFIAGKIHTPADKASMEELDTLLTGKPDVARVLPLKTLNSGTVGLIEVVPSSSPEAAKTSALISTIRSNYIPSVTKTSHTAIYVGGITAILVDFAGVLTSKLPLFVAVIVLLGCLLLMVAFRSVLVPLVAAVMNLLAVGASFGLLVAVFQWGWGANILGAGTGPIESFLPSVMIAILFGLSMDYQVFLVSRMHEEWLNTGDNEEAIIRGQANTGRVITAAALIMICVFLSFAIGGQRVIAEFGIGLGGAVFVDAFIIRTILVPSLMHAFGKANWWMPKWLDRVVPHVAVEATDDEVAPA